MDPVLLQKQVRDNAEDLRNYMQELKSWESEMKRKESELLTSASGDQVCVKFEIFTAVTMKNGVF
jgi:hypothetical protein